MAQVHDSTEAAEEGNLLDAKVSRLKQLSCSGQSFRQQPVARCSSGNRAKSPHERALAHPHRGCHASDGVGSVEPLTELIEERTEASAFA